MTQRTTVVWSLTQSQTSWNAKWALGSIITNKLVEVMEFQLSYLKSLKMILWKCCTQYVRKFGKLSSGHRTGSQFSFQSQRRAMSKKVQINAKLYSFHMLARLCSKYLKLGFSYMWTENVQMFKLDLEQGEEPEIKLSTSIGSQKKQQNYRKTSTSASLTTPKPLTVWITTNCDNYERDGNTRPPYLPSGKSKCWSRGNS